jgi:hypothetical protein
MYVGAVGVGLEQVGYLIIQLQVIYDLYYVFIISIGRSDEILYRRVSSKLDVVIMDALTIRVDILSCFAII